MKNFVKFERAYSALKDAHQDVFMFSVEKVSLAFEEDFRANRLRLANNLNLAKEALLDWFDENFPRDTADAARSDQFSYPAFFAMLRKHPELVESNEEALEGLLCSLKAKGLYGTGLEAFPKIDEFVNEGNKNKKAMVKAALKELRLVSSEALQIELKPVFDYLSARRPLTRQAYFKLHSMCGSIEQPTDDSKHLEQAKFALDCA